MQKFFCKYIEKYKAVRFLTLLILIVSLNGFDASLVPLKGKYLDAPSEITLTRSADSTWLKIADLFAAKGLKVKSIDKNKWQIITAKTSFISAYTFEGKEGRLEEPQAWVVLPKVFRK
jgi:hypothetical protein